MMPQNIRDPSLLALYFFFQFLHGYLFDQIEFQHCYSSDSSNSFPGSWLSFCHFVIVAAGMAITPRSKPWEASLYHFDWIVLLNLNWTLW